MNNNVSEISPQLQQLVNLLRQLKESEGRYKRMETNYNNATHTIQKMGISGEMARLQAEQAALQEKINELGNSMEDLGDVIQKTGNDWKANDAKLKEVEDNIAKEKAEQWQKQKKRQDREQTFFGRLENKGTDLTGGKLTGGGATALAIADAATKTIDAGAEIYSLQLQKNLNTFKANADVMKNQMETNGRIFQRHIKTFGAGMRGALQSSFASITQGVQEGAYTAATNSIDFANTTFSQTLDDNLDKLKMQQYSVLRMQQAANENLKLSNRQIEAGLSAATGIVGLFSPVGGVVMGIVGSIAKSGMKILEAQSDYEVQKLEYIQNLNEKQLEIYQESLKAVSEQAAQDIKEVLGLAKEIENVVTKTDASAKQIGVQMGFNAEQMAGYENAFFKAAKNLTFVGRDGKTHYLDKDNEDMMKMQSTYIESSGRNIQMDNADFVKMSLLGKLTGDDNLAAALLGDMDIFNKTIADSTDLINDMFTAANKAGVSNRKFAKDLQQNLKLAQKYNFKNGVKGVMEMSIWAQKTRISMQGLDNVMESLQKGGLEGAIEKSARLQVLGGRFAMGSNPLAMLSDAFSSPESMAERMKSMITGMGSFDKRTGEINFGVADQMLIRAYTDAMGLDYVETMNAARQDIKNKQIDKELRNQAYTEEQKALLYSKAQYDQKTGEWQIKYTDRNGEQQVKGINDLNTSDFEALMPVEEQIEKKVSDIYDLLAEQKGATNFQTAFLAELVKDSTFAEVKQRVHDNVTDVQKMSDEYKQLVESSNKFMTEQNQQQHKKMAAITNVLDEEFKLIKKQNTEAIRNFHDEAGKFITGLKHVNAFMELQDATYYYNQLSEEEKKNPTTKENQNIVSRYEKALAESNKTGEAFTKATGVQVANSTDAYGVDIENAWKKANSIDLDKIMAYINARDEGKVSDQELEKLAIAAVSYNIDAWHDSVQNGLPKPLKSDKSAREVLDYIYANILTSEEKSRKLGKTRWINPETRRSQEVAGAVERTVPPVASSGPQAGYFGSKPGILDAVSLSENKPSFVAASNVTPINDGQIAMTHPMDTGIFAKTGGPFDTLFNKIFDRINAIYDFIRPSFVEPSFIKETTVVITKSISEMKDVLNSANEAKSKPVEVNINGSIELKSGGQGIDIIGLLKNNPDFVRKITEMLAYQISSNTNGGKSEMFPKRFTW